MNVRGRRGLALESPGKMITPQSTPAQLRSKVVRAVGLQGRVVMGISWRMSPSPSGMTLISIPHGTPEEMGWSEFTQLIREGVLMIDERES